MPSGGHSNAHTSLWCCALQDTVSILGTLLRGNFSTLLWGFVAVPFNGTTLWACTLLFSKTVIKISGTHLDELMEIFQFELICNEAVWRTAPATQGLLTHRVCCQPTMTEKIKYFVCSLSYGKNRCLVATISASSGLEVVLIFANSLQIFCSPSQILPQINRSAPRRWNGMKTAENGPRTE